MPSKPTAAELTSLEQLLAQQAPELEKTAPKRLQELEALINELKRSPDGQISAASQKTLKRVFVWQVDLKRAEYRKRIEGLTKTAKTDPEAAKALEALKNVLAALDEAKRAVNAAPVSARAAMQKMEAASERALSSLQGVEGLGAPDPDATPPPLPVAGVLPKPATAPKRSAGPDPQYAAPSWVNSKLDPKKPQKK